MTLPEGIESEVLGYLHLEYGEDPSDPNALKIDDIEDQGEFDVAGTPTHFFGYPTSSGQEWVTVEAFDGSYVLGISLTGPKNLTIHRNLYKEVKIWIPEYETDMTIPLEDFGEGGHGFPDYKSVELPGGNAIELLVEAYTDQSPTSVTVGIKDGENELYVGSYVGASVSLETKQVGYITIIVGYID